MNILKISRLSMLWFCLLAIACAEDKGNYTYEDKAVITIDSISSMLSVLANAEYIDLKPVVTSNLEGIIDERNTNFEFAYQRKNSEGECCQYERPSYVSCIGVRQACIFVLGNR